MRIFLAIGCATFIAATAHAQTQERSLIDRLLRPDMSLKSEAQNKKFATRSLAGGKNATLGTFYVPTRSPDKNLAMSQSFSTKKVQPASFRGGNRTVILPQKKMVKSLNASSRTVEVRNFYDGRKNVDTRTFADQPKFVAQGKSQKSLDRKNGALTVDQVRELLNKNK